MQYIYLITLVCVQYGRIYSSHECNIPYCTETSVICLYSHIKAWHMNKRFNAVSTFANRFLFTLPCFRSVYSFRLFVLRRLVTLNRLQNLRPTIHVATLLGTELLPTSAIISASCRSWSLWAWSLLRMRIIMCNTGEYCTVALRNIYTTNTAC